LSRAARPRCDRRRSIAAILIVSLFIVSDPSAIALGDNVDSDGDGWPDSVERAVGTDPENPDTDGDTIIDSVDPTPLGDLINTEPALPAHWIDVSVSPPVLKVRQPARVQVGVRSAEGDNIDGQPVVLLVYYWTSWAEMARVEVLSSTLDDGAAVLDFDGAGGPGWLQFVAVLNLTRSRLGARATLTEVSWAKSAGLAGDVRVPVYPELFATATPRYGTLIPGLKESVDVRLYGWGPKESTDAFLSQFTERPSEAAVIGTLYVPAEGKVTIVHGVGEEERSAMLEVGVKGAVMTTALDIVGMHRFYAVPAGIEYPWEVSYHQRSNPPYAYVSVIDPGVLWLEAPSRVALFDDVTVMYSRYNVTAAKITPARFDELFRQGGLRTVVTLEPACAEPYSGTARLAVVYARDPFGYLLEETAVRMRGWAALTFKANVSGDLVISVDEGTGTPLPRGQTFPLHRVSDRANAWGSLAVWSPLAIRILPDKDFYFSGDRAEVALVAFSNGTSGTDLPIRVFAWGRPLGQEVRLLEGSARYDLGALCQGTHVVTAVAITDPVVYDLISAFGLGFLGEDLVTSRSIVVRDLALWVTSPRQVVSGLPVSLSATVLEGERRPLEGGRVQVELARDDGQGVRTWGTVADGSTDATGVCALTFVMPDVYLDILRVRATAPDGRTETYQGVLEPRPQDVRCILWTDKPIYRAGDDVLVRLLVWNADLLRPERGTVRLTLTDPLDRDVLGTEVALDAFGIAEATLSLGTVATWGGYTLTARSVAGGAVLASKAIEVKDYSQPKTFMRFLDAPDVVYPGDTVTLTVSVEYTYGPSLAGGEVTFRTEAKGVGGHVVAFGTSSAPLEGGEASLRVTVWDDWTWVDVRATYIDRSGESISTSILMPVGMRVLYEKAIVAIGSGRTTFLPSEDITVPVDVELEVGTATGVESGPLAGATVDIEVIARSGPDEVERGSCRVTTDATGHAEASLAALGLDVPDVVRMGGTEFTAQAIVAHPTENVSASAHCHFSVPRYDLSVIGPAGKVRPGEEAIVRARAWDLLEDLPLCAPFTLEVRETGDDPSTGLVYRVRGTIDGEMDLAWPVPEALPAGIYRLTVLMLGAEPSVDIEVADESVDIVDVAASRPWFSPGDEVVLSVDLHRPYEGLVYVELVAGGTVETWALRLAGATSAEGRWLAPDPRTDLQVTAYLFDSRNRRVESKCELSYVPPLLSLDLQALERTYLPGETAIIQATIEAAGGSSVPPFALALAVVDAALLQRYGSDDLEGWTASLVTPDALARGPRTEASHEPHQTRTSGDFGPDGDRDGLPDAAERFYGQDPQGGGDAATDRDGDSLDLAAEHRYMTSPTRPDTDGDGMPDGLEVSLGRDPLSPDSGETDLDADGMPDLWELANALDPRDGGDAVGDADGDGLSNLAEHQVGSDPRRRDTDHDGVDDRAEVETGTDPTDPADAWRPDPMRQLRELDAYRAKIDAMDLDNDGWNDLRELREGTDPLDANTDGDMYPLDSTDPHPLIPDDGWLRAPGGIPDDDPDETDPHYPDEDSNGEGMGQGQGQGQGQGSTTTLLLSGGGGGGSGTGSYGSAVDFDGDGLADAQELLAGTDPKDPDTDRDGLLDGEDPHPLLWDSVTDPARLSDLDSGGGSGSDAEGGAPPLLVPRDLGTPPDVAAMQVRKRLIETAYWAPPRVVEGTAAGGRWTVQWEVPLPESVTGWRATALLATACARGEARSTDFQATKDVIINVDAPTSVAQDDRLLFEPQAFNRLDEALDLELGVAAPPDAGVQVFGAASVRAKVPSRESASAAFELRFTHHGEVELTFYAKDAQGRGDAVVLRVTVEPNGALLVQHDAGFADPAAGGAVASATIHDDCMEGTRQVVLRLALGYGDLSAGASLDALGGADDTSEQAASRLLIASLGLEHARSADERARLRAAAYSSLMRLYAYQHKDGGFGWWKQDATNDWMTAYALLAMTIAGEEGVLVDANSAALARSCLERVGSLAPEPWMTDPFAIDAFVAMVLSRAGETDRSSDILGHLETVMLLDGSCPDPYTLSFVVLAHHALEGDDARLSLLADRLDGLRAEGQSHWEGSSLAGHDETTAWAVAALATAGGHESSVRAGLEWLARLRRAGGTWGTALDTASALLAIDQVVSTVSPVDLDVSVEVGGSVVRSAHVSATDLREFRNSFDTIVLTDLVRPGDLEVRVRASGSGDLFYELTVVEYLHPRVSVSCPASIEVPRLGEGRWGITASVPEGSTAVVGELELLSPLPEGVIAVRTELVRDGGRPHEVELRTTLTSMRSGTAVISPIVVGYTLVPRGDVPAVTRRPSQAIEAYLDPVLVISPESVPSPRGFGDLSVLQRLPLVMVKEVTTYSAPASVMHLVRVTVAAGEGQEVDPEALITVRDQVPAGLAIAARPSTSVVTEDGGLAWELLGAHLPAVLVYTLREPSEGRPSGTTVLQPATARSPEGAILGTSNTARLSPGGTVCTVEKAYSPQEARAFEPVHVVIRVSATGGGIAYAVVEDRLPPGFVLVEVGASSGAVGFVTSGSIIDFYVARLSSIEIEYTMMGTLQGRMVMPRARAFPLFAPEDDATSDSRLLTVLPRAQAAAPVDGAPAPSPADAPPTALVLSVPAQGIDSRPHVAGVQETILASLHNPGDGPLSTVVLLEDASDGELWRLPVALAPHQTMQLEIPWVPTEGAHLLTLASTDGNASVMLPGPLAVAAGPEQDDGGWLSGIEHGGSAVAVMGVAGLWSVALALSVIVVVAFRRRRKRGSKGR